MKFTWSYTSNKELDVESFPTKTMHWNRMSNEVSCLKIYVIDSLSFTNRHPHSFSFKAYSGGGCVLNKATLTPLSTRTTH